MGDIQKALLIAVRNAAAYFSVESQIVQSGNITFRFARLDIFAFRLAAWIIRRYTFLADRYTCCIVFIF